MKQRNKLFLDQNSHIESFVISKGQEKRITYLLEEDFNYVTGYTASLIYIMNGLAKVVYIIGNITKKEREIIESNCELTSIPIVNITSTSDELEDIDVLTIVDDSF